MVGAKMARDHKIGKLRNSQKWPRDHKTRKLLKNSPKWPKDHKA
jgi:hypothetical protein